MTKQDVERRPRQKALAVSLLEAVAEQKVGRGDDGRDWWVRRRRSGRWLAEQVTRQLAAMRRAGLVELVHLDRGEKRHNLTQAGWAELDAARR